MGAARELGAQAGLPVLLSSRETATTVLRVRYKNGCCTAAPTLPIVLT
jgi:hypothetical protein